MPSLERSLQHSSDLLDGHGGKYANLPRAKAWRTQIQLTRCHVDEQGNLYGIEAAGTKPIGIGQRVERCPLPRIFVNLGAALGPFAQVLPDPLGKARCGGQLLQGVPHVADLNRSVRRIQRAEPVDTEMGLKTLDLNCIPVIGRVHREPHGGRRTFHDFAEQPLLVVDLIEVGMDGLIACVRRDMDELVLVAVAAGRDQIDGCYAIDREAGDRKIVVKLVNRSLAA